MTETNKKHWRTSWQVSLTVVSILLGILFAAQLKTQQSIKDFAPSRRVEELADMLRDAEGKRAGLEKEVNELREVVAGYEKEGATGKSTVAQIRAQLEEVRIQAGLVEVEGEGIIVRLEDSKKPAKAGEDPRSGIVHDEDILKVVNELWAAGAEGVSVNGQRIVTGSEIRCAGPVIFINKTRTASPYIIKAIGDPVVLEAAVKLRGGYAEYLQMLGIGVNVVKSDRIVLPAYTGGFLREHVKLIEKGKGE